MKAAASDPWSDLMAAIPAQKRIGKLDLWLAELPKDRKHDFWGFIEEQTAKGRSIESLLAAWNRVRPPCPVTACTIRARLRERRG